VFPGLVAMRARRDDLVDAGLSLLAAPLTLPLAAVYAAVITILRASLQRQEAEHASHVLRRFFETGPWGSCFDCLTWLPWTRLLSSTAGFCLYLTASERDEPPAPVPLASDALPPPATNACRLVFISDTHGKHRLLSLPRGDILCHTGDVLSRNACIGPNNGKVHKRAIAGLHDFNRWLASTPHRHRVVVAGNHDAVLEQLGAVGAQQILSNAHYLQDSGVQLEDLRFWGSPWSYLGTSGNRAFQAASPTLPDNKLVVDVLLSHCHHDALAMEVKPLVYASGHAHEWHGIGRGASGIEVNSSICDGLYRAIHLPIVVDIVPPPKSVDRS